MDMKMKLTSGLLGVATLLVVSHTNAATIFVDPATVNVAVDETFTLTIKGDFSGVGDELVDGGGVLLSWDPAKVGLTDSIANVTDAVTASLASNNWATFTPSDVVVTASSVSVDVFYFDLLGGGFLDAPSTFDLFSLDLVAVPPPSNGPVDITASVVSALSNGWGEQDVNFVGAQINVSAVPVPAAVWLFGSGLIGLVGIARRRSPQSA